MITWNNRKNIIDIYIPIGLAYDIILVWLMTSDFIACNLLAYAIF